MQTLSLNGTWKLSFTDDFPEFLTAQDLPGRFALDAAVPAPVHQVLMDAGLLDDPRVGLNSLKARWVEESFWGYRRTFATPEGLGADTAAWLVFACLELNAVVYLNGVEVGRHANAHRPARFDVTGRLRADGAENRIVVLLESGLFANADKPGAEYRQSPQASLTKIHWQRRGQWQRGWDWQQRLLNVGILGDVRLEWADTPVPTQVQVYALPSADLRAATVHAKVSLLNRTGAPVNGELSLRVGEGEDGAGPTRSVPVAVPEGDSDHAVSVEIENPRCGGRSGTASRFFTPRSSRSHRRVPPRASRQKRAGSASARSRWTIHRTRSKGATSRSGSTTGRSSARAATGSPPTCCGAR
jgi:beta-galactosidase/beta-glucuronidase